MVLAVCDSAHRRGLRASWTCCRRGINCIGMSIEVADTAAVAYDVALLQALAGGETLREAHRIGIEAIGGRETTAPQLYPADNTSASLREQVATIQERVTSGDNAEALDLARKFVTELEAVQRREKQHPAHRSHRAADQPAVGNAGAPGVSSCGHHRRADIDRV